MNEELTMEVLEAMAKCNEISCEDCPANKTVCIRVRRLIEKLATALLEERAKPNVWFGAPEDAIQAQITWFTKNGGFTGMKTYTRELPKSRARQIAEELTGKIANRDATYEKSVFYFDGEPLVDVIEAVLNKYAEELEGKE